MSKIGSAKVFGGIGAILALVGGFFTGVISIVGLIMLFIAVKYISEEVKEEIIFRNFLICFILSIIAIIAVIAIFLVSIGGNIFAFTQMIQEATEKGEFGKGFFGFAGSVFVGIIVALVIGWILIIFASMYRRKSYDKIAELTKVDLFRTTGTLYFIGAVTLIIIVGLIILLIAKILEIVSFFSLPEEVPKPAE